MSMEINRGYVRAAVDYAEQRKACSRPAEKNQGMPAEICVGNTDQVEREIKKLEKKLQQVEQELSRKDNHTYRRQHTVFDKLIGTVKPRCPLSCRTSGFSFLLKLIIFDFPVFGFIGSDSFGYPFSLRR